jgi:hypothetical protein
MSEPKALCPYTNPARAVVLSTKRCCHLGPGSPSKLRDIALREAGRQPTRQGLGRLRRKNRPQRL